MDTQVQLSVEESLNFAAEQAYWDGFAAGVKSATEHVKETTRKGLMESKRPKPGPVPVTEKKEA